MKLYRGRNRKIPALSAASMPDLIFPTLFFFMLIVYMRKANVHVKYQVPMATELSRMYNNSAIQYIYIDRPISSLGQIEGKKMAVQLDDHITTIPEIKKYLIQLSAVLPLEQRKELSVSIKVDRHADVDTVMDLKQVLKEANMLNVNFIVTMSRNNKLK